MVNCLLFIHTVHTSYLGTYNMNETIMEISPIQIISAIMLHCIVETLKYNNSHLLLTILNEKKKNWNRCKLQRKIKQTL